VGIDSVVVTVGVVVGDDGLDALLARFCTRKLCNKIASGISSVFFCLCCIFLFAFLFLPSFAFLHFVFSLVPFFFPVQSQKLLTMVL